MRLNRRRGPTDERLGSLRAVVESSARQARLDSDRSASQLSFPTRLGTVRLQLDLSAEEGDRLIDEVPALRDWLEQRASTSEPAGDYERPLTREEHAILSEGGFVLREEAPLRPRRAAYESMLRNASSTREAAAHLGLTDARIRQRISERSLLAVKQGRGWLLPEAQFTADGLVPSIDEVIAAFPSDISALSALGFLTTPQPELAHQGRPLSPRDWLCETGNAQPVVRLARDL